MKTKKPSMLSKLFSKKDNNPDKTKNSFQSVFNVLFFILVKPLLILDQAIHEAFNPKKNTQNPQPKPTTTQKTQAKPSLDLQRNLTLRLELDKIKQDILGAANYARTQVTNQVTKTVKKIHNSFR